MIILLKTNLRKLILLKPIHFPIDEIFFFFIILNFIFNIKHTLSIGIIYLIQTVLVSLLVRLIRKLFDFSIFIFNIFLRGILVS